MTTKILSTKAKEIGERTIRFLISNEVTDRDGDNLIANGCDFSNYLKNPVFLPFHHADRFPLGKVVSIFIENNAVYADVYFPTVAELTTDPANASENAKLVDFTYHCYKTGMLNAVSVGFIIKKAEPNDKTDGLKVLEWELLEFSAVAIPANQEALAQAVKSFGFDKANKYFKSIKGVDNMDNTENPETTDEIKTLLKECTDEVKACKKEMEALKAGLKECTEEMKSYRKALEEGNANPDGQENPQGGTPPAEPENGDEEVLEIED